MKKILVIGDSCKDEFIYGECDRICPEAPVPIFKSIESVINVGMAENVYANLMTLDIDVDIITNKIKPIKKRLIEINSNQMIVRIDENDNIIPIKRKILENINYHLYDAIIISDYDKGYLSQKDILFISKHHNLVFLDTKKNINWNWIDNIKFIKINEKEYEKNKKFLDENYYNNLIVTLGKKGAFLKYMEYLFNINFPVENIENVRDISGAGDSFLAALVYKYLYTNDIKKAIHFANKCASQVIQKRGVSLIGKN